MEDPKTDKTIVRREVTRVLTPGTALDPALGAEQSNYLASVVVHRVRGGCRFAGWRCWIFLRGSFGLRSLRGWMPGLRWWMRLGGCGRWSCCMGRGCWVGLGRVVVGAWRGDKQQQRQIRGFTPLRRTILNQRESDAEAGAGLDGIRTKTAVEEWVFTAEYAVPLLRNHFEVHSLDGMGLGGHEAAAVAAGALLHYMRQTKQGGAGACGWAAVL